MVGEFVKVSVIMPSFLGEYVGAATGRIEKFHRAVNSFINQDYHLKELIIVSDGCPDTINEYNKRYLQEHSHHIKLIQIGKQEQFSGEVREAGLRAATGQLILYLDSDDSLKSNHCSNVRAAFGNCNEIDWVYFNDNEKRFHIDHLPLTERSAKLEKGSIGTSNIAHLNYPDIYWRGCDGYGHDFIFIERLKRRYIRFKKIDGAGYIVHHIPHSFES